MLSEYYSNKGTTEKPFQSDLLVPGDFRAATYFIPDRWVCQFSLLKGSLTVTIPKGSQRLAR